MIPEKVKNSSLMATCLITVGVTFAKTKLSILYTSDYGSLTTDIIKSVRVPVVINAVETPEFEKTKIHFINDLVMIFGPHNVDRALKETFWNADTRFFILFEKEEEMKKEFVNFWKFRVFNVYGVLERDERLLFFSNTLYARENCSMGVPRVVDECFNGQFIKKGTHFQNTNKISNLNGCPINISISNINPNIIFRKKCGVEVESRMLGFEGDMLYELSQRMNFTSVISCSLQGVGWLTPTPGGAVGDVYTGKSEFAMGVLGPALERLYYLDLSTPYTMDECLSFGVPKGYGARKKTAFYFFTYEFDNYSWILLIAAFFSLFIFFIFSNTFLKEKWLAGKDDALVQLFAGFMGMPVLTPKSSSQRISLLFWIFFSLIVTVVYKSIMGSRLTVPDEDPDINTFEELVATDLKFTGPKAMYLFLKRDHEKDAVLTKIVDKFVVADFETDRAVYLIATERNIAYLRHRSTFLYNALINPAATGHVHVIDTCVVSFHPVVATRKNSFFTKTLNDFIVRLEESGIMNRWRVKYIYDVPPLPQPFLRLGLSRFWGLLWLMFFGYLLSFLCFAIEIWLNFRHNRIRKNFFPEKKRREIHLSNISNVKSPRRVRKFL